MSDGALDVDRIVDELRAVLPADGVSVDREEREAYGHDALGGGRGFAEDGMEALAALAVVRPRSTEEVAAVVRIAAQRRVPVVPYGAGSGLMGGARSIAPSIVLDVARMNRVREVRAGDHVVWAEAGCVLSDVDAALAPHGLMLGHDPWTFGVATVGGALSTNGLGFLAGKYGSMGEQVLAVEAVMPDGTVVRTRAVRPRSTGVHLDRLFVAAEGTMGIVTAAAVRAFPLPESRELRGWRFATFAAGFEAILTMRRAVIMPTVLDFGDHPSAGSAEATLYLGFDGFREEVEACLLRSSDVCRGAGGAAVAQREVDEFWQSRHAIAERFAQARAARAHAPRPGDRRSFDYVHVALPVSEVLEYRRAALLIARGSGVDVLETGLWVSPSLFSVTLMTSGSEPDGQRRRMANATDELLRRAQEVGGSMEYCHGAGVRLGHLMADEHGAGLEVMRALKRAIDPNAIMNPGKLALS